MIIARRKKKEKRDSQHIDTHLSTDKCLSLVSLCMICIRSFLREECVCVCTKVCVPLSLLYPASLSPCVCTQKIVVVFASSLVAGLSPLSFDNVLGAKEEREMGGYCYTSTHSPRMYNTHRESLSSPLSMPLVGGRPMLTPILRQTRDRERESSSLGKGSVRPSGSMLI